MARDHARIKTSRQRDTEWRGVSVNAQWTYDAVVTSEALSYVGVIDYRPGRIAALAKGQTPKKVETGVKELEAARFVVVDWQTEELLVRTYVRHDGVLARVNMGKAMGRSLAKVVSLDVREAVMAELAKCYRDDKKAAGWVGFAELFPDDFEVVKAMASRMPLRMASGM
jgi:hypothetical protein